jgi:hypothetical protein
MSLAADRNQPWTGGVGRPRLAWWANDDLKPVFATAWHQCGLSVRARMGRAYESVPPTGWPPQKSASVEASPSRDMDGRTEPEVV